MKANREYERFVSNVKRTVELLKGTSDHFKRLNTELLNAQARGLDHAIELLTMDLETLGEDK